MQWGDLITLEYGKPIKDKESVDGPIPVYGTNGQIGTSHLKPLCEHPSFILGRKGAYRGVHYSDTPFSVIDTAFYAQSISDKVDLKWAYYKFLTYDINRMDSGSAIPSTDRYEIYSINVDLPDLATQRKVVSVLELLDNKIQDNNKINDCWPVASWSSLDYYNRWKPLHYYAKNFYAPLLCSAADAQGLVSLRVCSEQLRVQKCTVYWQLRGAQDAVLLEGQQTVDAQPLSVTPAGTVDCASWLTEKAQRQTVYLCYWMETEAGCTPVSVLLFCKPKHFRFAAPELSLSVQEQEDAFILTLAAEHMAKYVWLDSPDFDFILSDNCLDIVPGRPAVLILKKSDISRAVQADELKHLDTLCAYDIR